MALGVLEIPVAKFVEGQRRPLGLAIVASILLRVGTGADLAAKTIGRGAGVRQAEGRVVTEHDAPPGGSTCRSIAKGPGPDARRRDAEASPTSLGVPQFEAAGFGRDGAAHAHIGEVGNGHGDVLRVHWGSEKLKLAATNWTPGNVYIPETAGFKGILKHPGLAATFGNMPWHFWGSEVQILSLRPTN